MRTRENNNPTNKHKNKLGFSRFAHLATAFLLCLSCVSCAFAAKINFKTNFSRVFHPSHFSNSSHPSAITAASDLSVVSTADLGAGTVLLNQTTSGTNSLVLSSGYVYLFEVWGARGGQGGAEYDSAPDGYLSQPVNEPQMGSYGDYSRGYFHALDSGVTINWRSGAAGGRGDDAAWSSPLNPAYVGNGIGGTGGGRPRGGDERNGLDREHRHYEWDILHSRGCGWRWRW